MYYGLQESDQIHPKVQRYVWLQPQNLLSIALVFFQVLFLDLINYVALDLLFQNFEDLSIALMSIDSIQDLNLPLV